MIVAINWVRTTAMKSIGAGFTDQKGPRVLAINKNRCPATESLRYMNDCKMSWFRWKTLMPMYKSPNEDKTPKSPSAIDTPNNVRIFHRSGLLEYLTLSYA